jgi:hypothetical protein
MTPLHYREFTTTVKLAIGCCAAETSKIVSNAALDNSTLFSQVRVNYFLLSSNYNQLANLFLVLTALNIKRRILSSPYYPWPHLLQQPHGPEQSMGVPLPLWRTTFLDDHNGATLTQSQ